MDNQKPNFNAANQMQWSDQDMVGDLLSQEKALIGMYGTNITEGSTQPLRQALSNNLNQTIDDQFKVFQQMSQRGWYPTKNAAAQDITAAKQKTTQMKGQML